MAIHTLGIATELPSEAYASPFAEAFLAVPANKSRKWRESWQ